MFILIIHKNYISQDLVIVIILNIYKLKHYYMYRDRTHPQLNRHYCRLNNTADRHATVSNVHKQIQEYN